MQRRVENAQLEIGEAQQIYSVLFPGKIPSDLRARFEKASWIIAQNHTEEERAEYQRVVHGAADLEAIELVCRRRKRLPILSDHVVLMSFLAETLPGHYGHYVDPGTGRIKAYFALAGSLFRSAVKYAKGVFLRRRVYGA